MKRKVLSVLLCAGLAVSMLAGCGSGASDTKSDEKKSESTGSDLEYVKDKGTLVVGVTDFEPMDYKDDNGEWIGFDADMAKAICDKMGYDLKIDDMAFESILAAVSSGKAEFGAAGMTVTDERKESVDFTDTYANASQVVIVRK